MDYIDKTLNKVSKENKLILMMGDFNINLLNYESHSDTNEFLNNMISHYLPYILHPSRVTDHSATVINNIFSNNTGYDTFSGNILTNISDHFPQLLVINKVTIDYKRCSYAKRDFSNFSEDKFVSDYSKIDNEFLYDPDISLSSKFDTLYKNLSSCVDRHVPTKKMTKRT